MDRIQHIEHPALRPLWKSLHRDWVIKTVCLFSLLLFSLTATLIGLQDPSLLLLLGGLVTVAAAVNLYLQLFTLSPLQHIHELLRKRTEDIVWVYSIVTEHHPFGLQFLQRGILYFKLINGEEISAHLPPRKLRLITKVLGRVLPKTLFGYSYEREQSFLKNPRLLGKTP